MPASRGETQVHSTQDMIKRGVPIYNREFEAFRQLSALNILRIDL